MLQIIFPVISIAWRSLPVGIVLSAPPGVAGAAIRFISINVPIGVSNVIFVSYAGVYDGHNNIRLAGGDVPCRLDIYPGVSFVQVPLVGVVWVVRFKKGVCVIVLFSVLNVRFLIVEFDQLFSGSAGSGFYPFEACKGTGVQDGSCVALIYPADAVFWQGLFELYDDLVRDPLCSACGSGSGCTDSRLSKV